MKIPAGIKEWIAGYVTQIVAAIQFPVTNVFGRTGDIVATTADYDASQIAETPTAKILTDLERTKLGGIETGATADQTGAEIKAAYEAEPDTNAYTDAEKTKLAAIETGATADQTGAEIEALLDSALGNTQWKEVHRQAAALADLNLTVSDPPTQSEVQAVADAHDALLAALRASSQLAT